MIAFCILFFGFMATMWAMSRPVKCEACHQKVYGAHFDCPKGGHSFIVK
jgi:predicted RNA-binding Zn-ribbon protein involved in translation (DUF1610 family)